MTNDLDSAGQPLRRFHAHWVAAAIAVGGAAAIQAMWPAATYQGNSPRWWLLLSAATAYLLATARFHAMNARWRSHELVSRMRSLGRWLAGDALLGLLAGVLIWKGHNTRLFQAGLWLIPPVLIAASAAAALVSVLALRDGRDRLGHDTPPADAPAPQHRNDVLRFLCFALLAILLFAAR